METIEQLIETACENLDYDLDNSVTKAKACIAALRQVKLRRPRSVTVGGNPVSFEELASLLERAENWLAANWSATGSGSAGSSSSNYYDLSNVRR
jgi:hypothetical protein